jgi:hypothetical protein
MGVSESEHGYRTGRTREVVATRLKAHKAAEAR